MSLENIECHAKEEPEIWCDVPYERKEEFKHKVPMTKWSKRDEVWKVPLVYLPELHEMNHINIDKSVGREYNKRHDSNRYSLNGSIDGLDAEPYPYQKVAIGEMLNKHRFLLSLDMGLGKTFCTVAVGLEFKNQGRLNGNGQILVVVPSALKHSWADEIEKFTELDYTIIDGKPEERKEQWNEDSDIKIMNYALLLHDDYPLDQEWGMVALDEASFIKNAGSKRTKKAKLLEADKRYALSGTPVENDLTDLYNIMTFLDPYYFSNKKGFEARYLQKQKRKYGNKEFEEIVGHKNIEELKDKVGHNMFRKTKQEVLDDLPPITTKNIYVELQGEQKKEYDRIVDDMDQRIKNEQSIGGHIQFLQMLTDSTELLNESDTDHPLLQGVNLDIESPKTEELNNLAKKIEKNGDKALVFTKYKTMAESLGKKLDVDNIVLHGEHSTKERQEGLDKFENYDIPVLIATDIFSYGANLQFANYVVHFDSLWNPAKMSQRRDRIHRIGQDDHVVEVNFVTQDTIEEEIQKAKREKQELFDKTIEDIEDLSSDKIRELV